MKKIKIFVLLVGALMSLGYACGGSFARAGALSVERRSSTQTVEKGKAVYASNCARCHGGDGLGQTKLGQMVEAPDLTDTKWQKGRTDSHIRNSIVRGRGAMPAFGKKLSRDDVAALVVYVRTFRK